MLKSILIPESIPESISELIPELTPEPNLCKTESVLESELAWESQFAAITEL